MKGEIRYIYIWDNNQLDTYKIEVYFDENKLNYDKNKFEELRVIEEKMKENKFEDLIWRIRKQSILNLKEFCIKKNYFWQ